MQKASRVLVPVILLTCLSAVRAGENPEELQKRWDKWQEYAKTYKASALFPPLEFPRGIDWLAYYHEQGQTFEEYIRYRPNTFTEVKKRFVLQPVGTFAPEQKELLEAIREHMSIYFQCKVDMMEPVPLPVEGMRERSTGPQYLASSILGDVLAGKCPADALGCIGITCADIYPGEKWNFVFSSGGGNVEIHSLARYYTSFGGRGVPPAEEFGIVLRRALKIVAWNTGHRFSMAVCPYFQCGMNGMNSLTELDSHHIHLCPVCLKKLQWSRKFDVKKRYEELLDFYKKRDLKPEAEWMEKRLKEISEGKEQKPPAEEKPAPPEEKPADKKEQAPNPAPAGP